MMTLMFILGVQVVSMIFALIFIYVYNETDRKIFSVLTYISMIVSAIALLFYGLESRSLESTPVTYEVMDTNNKKYELKGYCDEKDMYCTTEGKETIKVISFKIISEE